ncbi:hypothetical protein [Streptomyces sp. KM273126]|nr:hypothetical protein [Streptomyces sp. KM273126]
MNHNDAAPVGRRRVPGCWEISTVAVPGGRRVVLTGERSLVGNV